VEEEQRMTRATEDAPRPLGTFVAFLVLLAGCAPRPTGAAALDLTLEVGADVDDATLARLSAVAISAFGDENGVYPILLPRRMNRIERLRYRPAVADGALSLTVVASDSAGEVLIEGHSGPIEVSTETSATIVLEARQPDLPSPDAAPTTDGPLPVNDAIPSPDASTAPDGATAPDAVPSTMLVFEDDFDNRATLTGTGSGGAAWDLVTGSVSVAAGASAPNALAADVQNVIASAYVQKGWIAPVGTQRTTCSFQLLVRSVTPGSGNPVVVHLDFAHGEAWLSTYGNRWVLYADFPSANGGQVAYSTSFLSWVPVTLTVDAATATLTATIGTDTRIVKLSPTTPFVIDGPQALALGAFVTTTDGAIRTSFDDVRCTLDL
jgi:hypothetical protein